MMRIFSCTALLVLFFLTVNAQKAPKWVSNVGAKNYPSTAMVYYVNDEGATADGISLNTTAIQKTIDKAAQAGGGVVSFRAGKYLTGSIFLKSNIRFEVAEGVELLGSQNIKDYPEKDTRVAGIEMKWPAALINVIGQSNVAITGKGLINGQAKPFWEMYWNMRKEYDPRGLRWVVDYDAKRPRTLLVANCTDVTVKEISLQQSGFWTVQLLYSKQVTVDGITVRNNINGLGPNTDGVDVDSSSWVLIRNCDIDCNEDNFGLKAGRDWDGLRVDRPTEYVVIRDCIARAGLGMVTCGSETSGGIRHVWASNLKGIGTINGLNIKSATSRGGVVEDIYFNNILMTDVSTVLQVSMNWNPTYSYAKLPENFKADNLPEHWKKMLTKVTPAEKGMPLFKDIYISNVKATGAKRAVSATGLQGRALQNFRFNDVKIEAAAAGSIEYTSGWKWKNSTIVTKDGTQLNEKSKASGK